MQPEALAITAAATLPPLLAALLLVRLAPPGRRRWVVAGGAFLWGAAVATTVAALVNDALGAWIGTAVGRMGAHRVPVLVGPLVEELAKGTAFVAVAVAWPGALDGVRSAVTIGALAGLGFTAAENVTYFTLAAVQAGWDGVVRALWVRGLVQLPIHALFTATLGLAVGWARRHRHPPGILALGLAAAVALHALWNGLLSRLVAEALCNAPEVDAACAAAPDAGDLLLGVPALVLAFVLPAAAALGWAVRRLD